MNFKGKVERRRIQPLDEMELLVKQEKVKGARNQGEEDNGLTFDTTCWAQVWDGNLVIA